MPFVRVILALLLAAPVCAAALDVPGVAHLELPEGRFAEADLALAKADASGIHLRPGERIVSGVRITGHVPLKDEHAALSEARLTFHTKSRSKAQSVVVRTKVLRFSLVAYEPRAGLVNGAVDAPVPLPSWLTGPVEVFLIDHSASVEQVQDARLIEDPRDAAPLGERRPLILVHGKDNHDLSEAYHDNIKMKPFEGLRSSPEYAKIRALYKPYFYQYPSYRSVEENARELVRLARAEFGAGGPERIAILAHSMGGLLSRRALATDGFAAQVAILVTTSSPHHGAIASSLIFANARISERIGALSSLLLRFGKSGEPDTPGLRSVAWDNYDGGITAADEATYAPLVNRELAAFNASFTHAGKVVTMMGDVHNLLFSGFKGPRDEAYRKVQGAWGERYANADPTVCHFSGIFEGAPVRARLVFDNFSHEQIIGSKPAVAAILRLLQGEAIAHP